MPPKRKAGTDSTGDQGTSAKKPKSLKDWLIPNKSKATDVKEVAASKDVGSNNLYGLLKNTEWRTALRKEFDKGYFKSLEQKLGDCYKKGEQIFPPKELIFNAFNKTPFDKVKVVLLGQDPYHDDGQAMGLSFSVPEKIAKLPPSLKNIYKELESDIPGFTAPGHGCLDKWADEGVLLLNATLTVKAHEANSHAKYGWQTFTDAVIKYISDNSKEGVVFLLWGGFAQKKEKLINTKRHAVVKSAHPSPLSVSKFMGCKCFSAVNKELERLDRTPINWNL